MNKTTIQPEPRNAVGNHVQTYTGKGTPRGAEAKRRQEEGDAKRARVLAIAQQATKDLRHKRGVVALADTGFSINLAHRRIGDYLQDQHVWHNGRPFPVTNKVLQDACNASRAEVKKFLTKLHKTGVIEYSNIHGKRHIQVTG